MIGWVDVLVIAFVAQLAVIPGEKVQFIISGLSTRYHPAIVVGAAGLSFAGWTALEIMLGRALKGALPAVVLDAFTAALFLFFGYMPWRSAPPPEGPAVAETDGGTLSTFSSDVAILGHELPDKLGTFVSIFAMMAAGEFGDKTQLVTIGLAAQYAAHPTAIWAGEMLAIIPISLLNAVFFYRFAHVFDLRKAHYFGAVIFAFFGLDTILAITTGFSVWEQVVGAASGAVSALGGLLGVLPALATL